ncbi:uncharacterized protein FMAN_08459 [Fusarium mangiferae]|uniref:Uncharacterized protein n=1 Tax=Fusarium mangiferae TaxID=192010 RepID=A0A1L7TSW7_FUSMA|nr:uncharacterized protein FMAN_08459 [Fusarium mangiferae]CVK98755.1 uncharacterized protein FMAN_08459 [Fusarium mangiferae]
MKGTMEAFKPNYGSPELVDLQSPDTEPQSKQGYPPGELMDIDDCQEQQRQTPNESAPQAELSDLKTQLQEKTQKLEELQEQCDIMSKDAIKNSQMLKESQEKCGTISQEVTKKDQDVIKFRKLWKKAATEHDKFRASGQGFYQITDEYLVELINHLRLNIRDLSIQYFDGIVWKGDRFIFYEPGYFYHLNNTTLESKGFMRYLESSTTSHEVVQGFLWTVIVHEIFDKFEWLGSDTCYDFRHLRHGLKPLLLLEFDYHINVEKSNNYMKDRTEYHVKRIINTIGRNLLKKDKERGFKNQLSAIITEAFALDKEISRQVARVIWRFNVSQQEENVGHPDAAPSNPGLVMAPAVFKRGKSTGEGFDHETKLLDIVEGSK